jgi:hypothetical protein
VTTPPSPAGIHVATDTLRTEAATWQAQSERLADITERVRVLDLGRMEAGVFQVMVGSYREVVHAVTDRCLEGTGRTREIADTLRRCAETYDVEEAKNLHMISKLY